MFTKKMVAAFIAAVVVVALLAVPIIASNGNNGKASGEHPGWGYSGDRPGWGYGDTNHTHTGPPGLSK